MDATENPFHNQEALRGEPAGDGYLCSHAVKTREFYQYLYGADCLQELRQCRLPRSCLMGRLPPTELRARDTKIRGLVSSFQPGRLGLGNVNDVGSCWPKNCPPEIPQEIWREKLRPGLERNGLRCRRPELKCCCN